MSEWVLSLPLVLRSPQSVPEAGGPGRGLGLLYLRTKLLSENPQSTFLRAQGPNLQNPRRL